MSGKENPFERLLGGDPNVWLKLAQIKENQIKEIRKEGARSVSSPEMNLVELPVNSNIVVHEVLNLTKVDKKKGNRLFSLRDGLISWKAATFPETKSIALTFERNNSLKTDPDTLLKLVRQTVPNLLVDQLNILKPETVLANARAEIKSGESIISFPLSSKKGIEKYWEMSQEMNAISDLTMVSKYRGNGVVPFSFIIRRMQNLFDRSAFSFALLMEDEWNDNLVQWCYDQHRDVDAWTQTNPGGLTEAINMISKKVQSP